MSAKSGEERVLDGRDVLPRDRHPMILGELDTLEPGESLVLVNDHDPKPLYYELIGERPGQFEWTPLEQGPEPWSVRIRRLGAASEPRTTARPREEHRALAPRIDELAALASRLLPGSWPTEFQAVQRAVEFLRPRLLPHARLEEEVIYPAVERALGAPGATATMIRDHREGGRPRLFPGVGPGPCRGSLRARHGEGVAPAALLPAHYPSPAGAIPVA